MRRVCLQSPECLQGIATCTILFMATLTATQLLPSYDAMAKSSAPSVFSGKAWQQVLARDRSADGVFVYAVSSTGIYCRPSCPSRRPERRNVRFFPNAAAAEAAGFRACLRCEPQLTAPKADPQAEAIARAARFVADRTREGEHARLDKVAQAAGLGKFATLRGFKRVLGVTPGEFARAQRKESFRDQVRAPRQTVTDAIYAAGFSSNSRLYEDANATLGMTPSTMKAGGAGETIRYTTADSPLGLMLVAATQRGLCSVCFADTAAQATAGLQERFARAELVRDDNSLRDAVRFVLSSLGEHPAAATLSFDIRATAFQQRVWQALRSIPRGETRTYSQIAAAVGAPHAVRAVGAACGANPLAVVIPCHRVVGSKGALTGYAWGIQRKKKLLELEQAADRTI